MHDKEIEELLRESWQPEPPEGMRDRVIIRARRELTRRILWFPRVVIPRWQVGLAVAALLVFLASGISNTARENRLAALESSDAAPASMLMAQRSLALGESRMQVYKLLRDSSADPSIP